MSANTIYSDKLPTSPANTLKRKRMKRPRTHWLPYMLIAPAVLLIMSFLFYPMANVFYYSFQNFNPAKPYYNGFIGLDNFKSIFSQDELFYSSLLISFKWVSIEVVFQLIFGLLIAL
ncbi:carbohydrate ABC transporter permease, partial [Paenibacillus aceris]